MLHHVLHEKLTNQKVLAPSSGGGTDVLAQRKDLEERETPAPNVGTPKKGGPPQPEPGSW